MLRICSHVGPVVVRNIKVRVPAEVLFPSETAPQQTFSGLFKAYLPIKNAVIDAILLKRMYIHGRLQHGGSRAARRNSARDSYSSGIGRIGAETDASRCKTRQSWHSGRRVLVRQGYLKRSEIVLNKYQMKDENGNFEYYVLRIHVPQYVRKHLSCMEMSSAR